jgi:hypothetical protein
MRRVPKYTARKRRTLKQKLRAKEREARLVMRIERKLLWQPTTSGPVTSVHARTGKVVAVTGDYPAPTTAEASYTSYARTILVRSNTGFQASLSLHTEKPHGNQP